jgi:predicted permease
MSAFSWLRSLWAGILHGSSVRSEMEQELRTHIALRADDLECSGLSRGEAERRARIEFGGFEKVRETMHEALGGHLLRTLAQDLRYALRMLRKTPGLAIIAVASLALGIGANTAIFSLTNALLLDAMPVAHPEQLRLLAWQAQHQFGYKSLPMESLYGSVGFAKTGTATGTEFSWEEYEALRQNQAVFDGFTAYFHGGGANIEGGNDLERGTLEYVAPNFFDVLGVRTAAGRTMLPSDGSRGGAPVVVLSDWIWRDMFGRSPSIIGKTIEVNRVPLTVVGVAPQSFHGAGVDLDPALYLPLQLQPQISPDAWDRGKSRLQNGDTWWVRILGRIKPGVTNAQAAAALDGIFRQTAKATLHHADRIDQESVHLVVQPGGRGDAQRTDTEFVPMAIGLSALAALVLVLACVNLANLLLARAATRRRELSVRMALGARRGRVARQLLTESMMLALFGGVAGVALGFALRNVIPHFLEHQPTSFDWRVYAFAAGLTLLTGLLFGGIPAWRATGVEIRKGLQDGARSTADRSHSRLGRSLVVLQVCLSMILLTGAGLFVRTVRNLLDAPLGFAPHHILLFDLVLPRREYATPEQSAAAFRQLTDRLRALPGVEAASFSAEALVSGDKWTANFDPTGEPKGKDVACTNIVGDGFFHTMEIPLREGRDFGPQDTAPSPKVAIVNEQLARQFFPHRDPIGLTFNTPPIRIVGIAGDTKFSTLRQAPPPTYYLPESQNGQRNAGLFEVKTAGNPTALVNAARRTVRSFDPQLFAGDIRTQQEQIDDTIRNERLFEMLTAAFGGLALVLACIGIYGIMAYTVSQRTSEIGIRMALGAEPRRVMRAILGEAWWMTAIGIAAGIVGALAVGRLAASLLYGVQAWDAVSLCGSAAVLGAVALAAGWFPARRAAKVDPMQALRTE